MYLSLFSLLQHLPFHTVQDHLATVAVALKMHTCPLSAGVVEMLFVSGRKQATLGQVQFLRRGKKCKKDISLHLSKCRARLQRISIQKHDESFRSRHPKCFQSHSQKTGGTSLQVSGTLITDPVDILREWSDHFTTLGKSHCSSNPALQEVLSKIEAQTYDDVELILDSPFLLEEVEAAIKHLKRGSSGGPDSLSPHHLLHTGTLFKECLCEIFNKIIDFESNPVSFKEGIIIQFTRERVKTLCHQKATEGSLLRLL